MKWGLLFSRIIVLVRVVEGFSRRVFGRDGFFCVSRWDFGGVDNWEFS